MNKVYGVLLSPFVRKVVLTLEYKKIPYENIFMLPGSRKTDFLAISPLGKIPAFEDEYIKLCDSSVICQYLDDKYPAPSIYPNNPQDKARALWLEEFSDSKLAELLGGGIFFEVLVAPGMLGRPTDHAKVTRTARTLLPPFLTYLEKQIHGNNFLAGGQPGIADFSLPAIFMNACYAGYQVDKFSFPKLHSYLQFIWDHPLYRQRFAAEKDIVSNLAQKGRAL